MGNSTKIVLGIISLIIIGVYVTAIVSADKQYSESEETSLKDLNKRIDELQKTNEELTAKVDDIIYLNNKLNSELINLEQEKRDKLNELKLSVAKEEEKKALEQKIAAEKAALLEQQRQEQIKMKNKKKRTTRAS